MNNVLYYVIGIAVLAFLAKLVYDNYIKKPSDEEKKMMMNDPRIMAMMGMRGGGMPRGGMNRGGMRGRGRMPPMGGSGMDPRAMRDMPPHMYDADEDDEDRVDQQNMPPHMMRGGDPRQFMPHGDDPRMDDPRMMHEGDPRGGGGFPQDFPPMGMRGGRRAPAGRRPPKGNRRRSSSDDDDELPSFVDDGRSTGSDSE